MVKTERTKKNKTKQNKNTRSMVLVGICKTKNKCLGKKK